MIQDHNSWRVCLSGDTDLNFLIYTATAYGLFDEKDSVWPPARLFEVSAAVVDELKVQWASRWNQTMEYRAHGSQGGSVFVPPFEKVEQPELREALIQAFPSFIRWWQMPAGGQNAMYAWEDKPNISSYVRELETELGRDHLSFCLNVDLVYGGIREPIEIGEEYMVMPIRGEYMLNKEWWKKKLAARIR
ncbi:hypothetical protein [Paenibacillus chibensis]|uniref:hypothetical protein n=1 Tax=Paenibacillus chibensis TaxID=59846 RepID=UPI0013E29772|nr:hypothetical protein [Paenibacillus chibensis]MEC0368604.1 hypothetical protein [Paenibacillus chibensis]